MSTVVWHDLECGGYGADLTLWRELAAEAPGPLLDVGAGTGRVTLDLAARGHLVTALDLDGELIGALAQRAAGLRVRPVHADAREFDLPERYALCLVPMQTLQLLGGPAGRLRFLRCAQRHLRPGATLAAAIVSELEPFELRPGISVLPDTCERDGVLYWSQPTAVRVEPEAFVLERRREVVEPDGRHTVSRDVVRLDRVSAEELEREARKAGLAPLGRAWIDSGGDYVASEVVMLGA